MLIHSEKNLTLKKKEARNLKITHALSNSFGFGGTNGSLIFSKYS